MHNQIAQASITEEKLIGGKLIIAAADTWDHYENTLSGKRPTHADQKVLTKKSLAGSLDYQEDL